MRKDFEKERRQRGGRYKGKEGVQVGPKTFRRGRAIAFLEMMKLKRSTIKQQLDEPEFQSIREILVGELKAIDMVINEFMQVFDIHESETVKEPSEENDNKELAGQDEKGIEFDETN